MDLDLNHVLSRIHQSGIEVTLRSRWNRGWQLQIESEEGQIARGVVASLDDAAAWLHEQMLLHCPQSSYSQMARDEVHIAVSTDASVRDLR